MSQGGNMICELANGPRKVVLACRYADECQLFHRQSRREDCYKVSIALSLNYSAPLPFPLKDINTVSEAVSTYIP